MMLVSFLDKLLAENNTKYLTVVSDNAYSYSHSSSSSSPQKQHQRSSISSGASLKQVFRGQQQSPSPQEPGGGERQQTDTVINWRRHPLSTSTTLPCAGGVSAEQIMSSKVEDDDQRTTDWVLFKRGGNGERSCITKLPDKIKSTSKTIIQSHNAYNTAA